MPLRLEGEATEVMQNNGLVDPAVDAIEVVTTPRNIPAEFVIDVSAMTMDTVIRLEDVPMPAGVTAAGDPDMPIVTVLTMRAEVAEIEAADAELAEEQHAEGEAGEGEAAPAPEAESGEGDTAERQRIVAARDGARRDEAHRRRSTGSSSVSATPASSTPGRGTTSVSRWSPSWLAATTRR